MTRSAAQSSLIAAALLSAAACGEAADEDSAQMSPAGEEDMSSSPDADEMGPPIEPGSLPYMNDLVSYAPGQGAGYGQDDLPEVVLGPPNGAGSGAGSLEVLSLGVGGTITLGFAEETAIVDGEGPDFVVFENPFYVGGDPLQVFAELGEVSVSEDGQTWHAFACDPAPNEAARWPGCAGWTPTKAYEAEEVVPIDPAVTGGDVFDLADVPIQTARFVRIRDLAEDGTGPSAGFDLDAVGVIHLME